MGEGTSDKHKRVRDVVYAWDDGYMPSRTVVLHNGAGCVFLSDLRDVLHEIERRRSLRERIIAVWRNPPMMSRSRSTAKASIKGLAEYGLDPMRND